jgi:hypothetical protein
MMQEILTLYDADDDYSGEDGSGVTIKELPESVYLVLH